MTYRWTDGDVEMVQKAQVMSSIHWLCPPSIKGPRSLIIHKFVVVDVNRYQNCFMFLDVNMFISVAKLGHLKMEVRGAAP